MKKRECLFAEGEKLPRKVLVITSGARAKVCFGSVGRESLCLGTRRKKVIFAFSRMAGWTSSPLHTAWFFCYFVSSLLPLSGKVFVVIHKFSRLSTAWLGAHTR